MVLCNVVLKLPAWCAVSTGEHSGWLEAGGWDVHLPALSSVITPHTLLGAKG